MDVEAAAPVNVVADGATGVAEVALTPSPEVEAEEVDEGLTVMDQLFVAEEAVGPTVVEFPAGYGTLEVVHGSHAVCCELELVVLVTITGTLLVVLIFEVGATL